MGEVELEIEDGDILGRDTAGKTFLQAFPGVSRKHAVITYNGKAWEIEDLGSTNGTYINSRQIPSGKKAVIKSGDKLGISKKVVFEVK
ncbi:MAG: FHA domain-containing protein [Candidatus Riflebacteria bacterium]|nr:FHA domain-containing protein [Candidatus Riflebacteria bacterium]